MTWFWQRKKQRYTQEPGAVLFRGLRTRLTLWYCGVLGAALILFGVAIYLGAFYFLFTPIEQDAQRQAHMHAGQWVMSSPVQACFRSGPPYQGYIPGQSNVPVPGNGPIQAFPTNDLVVCYDQNGSLLKNDAGVQLPAGFVTGSLAKTALQTGQSASDIVDAGGAFGRTYRYAIAVSDQQGTGHAGVVMVGVSVQTQENALSLLLLLLLAVGGITLCGAGMGGLFLARRALAPAHLSFTRQQRFIADASHELRTPLTLMRADAEVILRGREHLAEEDAVLLEDIVLEANHMSVLANSMLTLARLDAGSQHREHDVVSLDAVTLQGVERVGAFARQKGVIVRRELANDIVVIGDSMQLEQALIVVLDNAIKYNRSGGEVVVSTAVSNNKARLEVRDTGIGIAAEHIAHLGERFYRVDKARSRESGGTGLGLSIAQRIVSMHNGTLTLSSILNQGTSVTLLFPLAHSGVIKQIRAE